ncbi:MAG: hypothetical protein ACKPBF_12280, partial [Actinomycetota bacterium]
MGESDVRKRRAMALAADVVAHALLDEFAPLLQVAIRHAIHFVADPDCYYYCLDYDHNYYYYHGHHYYYCHGHYHN